MVNKNVYLERYACPKKYLDVDQFTDEPGIIVVIPAHNEPDLLTSLQSIEDCQYPVCGVEVIIVINASKLDSSDIKNQNESSYGLALNWSKNKRIKYHLILENELPPKHAGVGLARKIGMDEAFRMFHHIHQDGVILCFDADSTCLPNLLTEIEKLFFSSKKVNGCSIHYEHPLAGSLPADHYEGIVNYELHLRYYIDALKIAEFPYAFQTIGSSMAVRSSIYGQQGGMNRRKAGEDFYFLHKIIPLGDFVDLNTTSIIPSPRQSDRVPFGTGKAIGDWLDSKKDVFLTYAPETFVDLKQFFSIVRKLYRVDNVEAVRFYDLLPESVKTFMPYSEFAQKIKEISIHSTHEKLFYKRFFDWFDGFKVLKYVHHTRDHHYPNVTIESAVDWLFEQINVTDQLESKNQKLIALRKWDKDCFDN